MRRVSVRAAADVSTTVFPPARSRAVRDHIVGHEMAAGALTDAALAERAKSDPNSVRDDL